MLNRLASPCTGGPAARAGSSSSASSLGAVLVSCLLSFGCLGEDDAAPQVDSSAAQGGPTGGNGAAGSGVGGTGSGGTSGGGTAGSATGATGGTGGSSGGSPGTGGAAGVSATGGMAGGPAGGGATGQAGSGGAADVGNGGAGGTNGAGTGGSAGSGPAVHFVGRVDTSDPEDARFAWSGTGVIARFEGTEVSARLGGGQEYTVVLDDDVQPKLSATNGLNVLASGLPAGEHTVELYRRTEASLGVSSFMGFDFGTGTLLSPPVAPARQLEFIGDSITCGYGNEGADMNCPFSADTENHYLTYAALTARALDAELSTIAWSGKGVVCNYGDASDSCENPLPAYYDRTLPDSPGTWDFSRFQPDAVVVNLGTNDMSTSVDPSQAEFEAGYRAFLEHLRDVYPDAHIFCTNGPMLSGTDLSTLMGYIDNVVEALGDPKITSFDIAPQDGSDGYGCDWHPSLERHEKVATVVTAELRDKLGW